MFARGACEIFGLAGGAPGIGVNRAIWGDLPKDCVRGAGDGGMHNEGQIALSYVEIEQVLARYSRGIDRMDRDLILSVYWEDAYVSLAVCEGDPVVFADWIAKNMDHYRASSHMLGQSSIQLNGDRAGVETYFAAFHHAPRDDGDAMRLVGGRYVDRFERRGGEWRIHRREVLIDWVQDSPMGDALSRLNLIQPTELLGRRDRADRSYQFLAEHKSANLPEERA
jgi:hypothetical protein